MATNTSDFFTFSKTAGTAKNLQKPTDGGDNNLWGGFINVDLDTIVGAVNATSDLIADANQNELVDFTATGSAVNHVGITNAATGNGPTIEAKGDDTNIDLNIAGKGSGTAKFTSNIIIPDAGNIGSVSDPDAISISSSGIVILASGNGRRLLNITTITATGAYSHSLNANTTHVICWVQAAGGGGAGSDSPGRNSSGGGAGGFCIGSLDIVYATDSTLTGSVGTAGSAGAISNSGGDGGGSSVVWNTSNNITCNGGTGGLVGAGSPILGGAGGSVSVSGFNSILSQTGSIGRSVKNGSASHGGSDGGDSFLGFGGAGASTNQSSATGQGFGAGGGGGCGDNNSTNKPGGSGASGIIVIYEYI